MPIAKLFIEGNLEAELLNPVLAGNPVLQRGGSKNSLKPRAADERRENRVNAGYLRDRDFDFDPPVEQSVPTTDATFEGSGIPFGWRWCRHEIENYLIEPQLVNQVLGWQVAEIEAALLQAASEVRHYEVARWSIGIVRRALPPHFDLRTRPVGLAELRLPTELDFSEVVAWAKETIDNHREQLVIAMDPATVQTRIDELVARFDDAFLADVSSVLLWFSGKDLLAGLDSWLQTKGILNPGIFRAALRDWIIANPERALDLLPEWKALVQVLRR